MKLRRIAIIAAFFVPLYFALCTNHLWEDFFITFRVSKNLVAGHGLVYQPGERVHVFTSPLGVLVPAFCSWIAGSANDVAAIWLFRVICCGCLAATMAMVLRIVRHMGLSPVSTLLVVLLFVFDGKTSDFTINGMETAMVLLFFAWMLLALIESDYRAVRIGIGVAGLLWTRPDGFVFAGALLVGFAAFFWWPNRELRSRALQKHLLFGLLLAGLMYLPWFAWAWHYYGSPVPNTIIAKSAVMGTGISGALQFPSHLVSGYAWTARMFMPSYYLFGGWPAVLYGYAVILAVPAALYFVCPWAHPITRAISFSLFLGGAYVECIPQFPWYYIWWQLLALLVCGAIVNDYVRWAENFGKTEPLRASRYLLGGRLLVGVVLAVHVGLWSCIALQVKYNQALIEEGVRRPIGEWLHRHALPGDSVMLEPLGYIGYYSGLKTLDWPGLSAPEMTRAIRSGIDTWPKLVEHFQPNWVVMRPQEIQAVMSVDRARFTAEYKCVFSEDARKLLAARAFYPGRNAAECDALFYVFVRRVPRTITGAVAAAH